MEEDRETTAYEILWGESRGRVKELRNRATKIIYHNTQNGMRVYLVNDTSTLPAIITNDDPVKSEAQLVSIDAVGREHLQPAAFPCSRFKLVEARIWN
eukprot:6476732-Prymnesium_polylepis.1